jgi:magnesium-transporting ATPase (P-type)
MDNTPIYGLRSAEVFLALESSPQGLTDADVAMRRSLYGNNLLIPSKPRQHWPLLLAHLIHPMALTLWAAGGLAMVVGQPVWGALIWLLVLSNAGFSFWREYRAEQIIDALSHLLPAYARVVRKGQEQAIPASELVPGDILVLAEGDNIPADARVVEEYGLRTNNATLTGEAIPVRKTADASLHEGMSELERPNLVFAGTSVVSGTSRAVVYATGMVTQFGRIARLSQSVEVEPSPLQVELAHLTRVISLVALFLAGTIFVVGVFDATIHLGINEEFLLALGTFVAIVPEGLPATVTLTLAMAGQRLAHQGVLVKKLSTLETLGTVSVICTDKSGTLTQNQMNVREIWVGNQRLRITGEGYEPKGVIEPFKRNQPIAKEDLHQLLTAALLCNNARLNPPTLEHPQWTSLGDQTEAALRVTAIKGGLDERTISVAYPRVHELPFDARRKRMSTLHRRHREQIAFIKGSPREVLGLCKSIFLNGEVRPLDAALRAEIMAVNDDYASRAMRVLALAQRTLPDQIGSYSVERIEQDLTFLGLMAMMDPPRPEVAEAMQVFRQASVRMVMITGDYGLTAESLARRIGLIEKSDPLILTGAELDELNDVELSTMITRGQEMIFARMAPEHKLRLVAAFQAQGEVVAVIGDGVNDAPALRKADVGIVMGIIGTDVAKDAADLIITNDNFYAIVRAIGEGRAVYENLRKFTSYIFASNVPEVLPFLLRGLFAIPLALTFKQILAIDLGTDLLPALALGTEKPEPDIMEHPPRRRSQRLVDRSLIRRSFLWLGMIEAGLCYAGYAFVYILFGQSSLISVPFLEKIGSSLILNPTTSQINNLAVTVYWAGVVMAQVGNAFACRTERLRGRALGWLSNPGLLVSVMIEILLVFVLVYYPPLAEVFDLVALPPVFWLGLGLFAPALYGLEWLRKMYFSRR